MLWSHFSNILIVYMTNQYIAHVCFVTVPCVLATINLTATAYTQTFVSHDGFDGTTSYPK